jgi:cellobiose phosphorylase
METEEGFRVFSPFFVPTLDEFQLYECHVGLGYTRIISEFYGLRTDVTIFVPLGGNCELRDIKITNISNKPIKVDAIPVVEYTHPDALKQFTNADWVPQTMQSNAVEDGDFTILVQYPYMLRDVKVNYLTSNLPASSFETDRKFFLGDNEYGTYKKPLSLFRLELAKTQALRGDNIAALLHHLDTLKPGETRCLITQLGQVKNIEHARADMQRFRQPEVLEEELTKIEEFWTKYLSTLQVQTPDESMNIMLNIHNPHQCYVTKTWSRYLSYYQTGLGSRGIGVRDSSQDVLAIMAPEPAEGKEFIKTLLSFQKGNGSSVHQFNPLTMEGSAGDSMEMVDHPHYYSDDHLWTILAVTAYLKETGDFAFLDEVVPFYEKDNQGNRIERQTVIEHLDLSLSFTRKNVGKHGLPLLGFADWNDTINLPAGAESLFTANLYGKALLEVISLMEYLGKVSTENEYRDAYDEMKSRVESTAWDGEWFISYLDADGNPLGSSKNTYGQIQLNGQSWPVISGFASSEHARRAMDTVFSKLNTKYGIKISTPSFRGYDLKYGGVTTFPPGTKENGGIFVHLNPWAIIAETMLGNGDRAYRYYAQINPADRNAMIEVYECEPYVYAQNILGDENPQFGLARNSWLSGSAAWCYLAATQYILGIRPEYTGLRIDPCIPSTWSGYSTVRRFRGRILHFIVHNPQHICKGVVKMTIDGKNISDNLVPVERLDSEHQVEVWLGIK